MIRKISYVAKFIRKNSEKIPCLDLRLYNSKINIIILEILGRALDKGTYPVKLHASTDVERANAEKVKEQCPRVEIAE